MTALLVIIAISILVIISIQAKEEFFSITNKASYFSTNLVIEEIEEQRIIESHVQNLIKHGEFYVETCEG